MMQGIIEGKAFNAQQENFKNWATWLRQKLSSPTYQKLKALQIQKQQLLDETMNYNRQQREIIKQYEIEIENLHKEINEQRYYTHDQIIELIGGNWGRF